MSDPSLFKWRHFEAGIIFGAVCWYLRYALSNRDKHGHDPTLLVKSRLSIPHARGVRVTRGMASVSLAFKDHLQDCFAACF